jgi:hypothetical protein
MKLRMTQNAFLHFFLFLLYSTTCFATAESPVVQGVGGGAKAGIPSEANFSNPAAVALLTQSSAFYFYQKSQIPDWNAGGKVYGIGAYDSGSTTVKGSFVYLRNSRARISRTGTQVYEDRTEYRFAMGLLATTDLKIGIQPRYIIRHTGETNTKVFDGDVGAIYPIYKDLVAGFTYENILNKQGEKAPTMATGLVYAFSQSMQVFADGMRLMKGENKGDRGWAVGGEFGIWGQLRVRGGKFLDVYKRKKGWVVGGSWTGPRTSFDYALRSTGEGPKEKDHTLSMKVAF